jgi:phage FluMu protein Com
MSEESYVRITEDGHMKAPCHECGALEHVDILTERDMPVCLLCEPESDAEVSQKQYLSVLGNKCPNCGEQPVTCTDSLYADDGVAWQNCKCPECKAEWTDQYRLIGYVDLTVPE